MAPVDKPVDASVTSAAGVALPRLLYGTAWKKTDTGRLVTIAVREGFRGIDTACQPRHYDEAGVGAGVAVALGAGLSRSDLYLQTKFTPLQGQDPARVPYDPRAPLHEQIAQSFAASLQNLRTDYLDCLVLHSPLATLGETLRAWECMESLAASGGVRQLGISNCYEPAFLEAMYRAVRIKPAVIQNRFHAETSYDRELRAFCRRERIIYQSFWTLTANPRVLAHPAMLAIASRLERTPAQVLFRYLIESEVVPLTGTRSVEHMRDDLAAFDFELSPADRQAVAGLLGEDA
ncbi:MAG: aldo/keto reductase family protein [Steroidobacteraceae bacterium]